tara:strand:- start:2597 stop:4267 length:1671 start_codon:yes stop_codon:yes gene_type:complete
MAIKIYNDITLDSNQIKDVSLERLATGSEPAGFEGQIYYNTTENAIRYYNGAAWIELDGAGDVTTVTATNGVKNTADATDPVIEVDYTSTNDNIVSAAGSGTTLATGDEFIVNDGGTVLRYTINDIISLATSDVTSLTVAVGSDSTGTPISQNSPTGAVTLTSHPYNGGSNIGYVPAGGGSLTFLNGDGNWSTPLDTQAEWTAAANTGTSQDISDGTTLLFSGSTGIDTAVTTNTLTFTLNLSELGSSSATAVGTDRVAGVWNGSQGTKQLQGIPINLFGTPTANVGMGSNKITGLADPTNDQDAATKAYVDAAIVGGLTFKGAYDASSNPGSPVLTGAANIASTKGDVYSVSVAGDFGSGSEAVEVGDLIIINDDIAADSSPADSLFDIVQNNIDLATNSVAGIAKFPTGNGFATMTAGTSTAGVVKLSAGDEKTNEGSTSESLTITTDAFGKITAVNAAAISITTSAITNFDAAVETVIESYSTTIAFGDNSATSFTLTHSFGTRDVMVQVYEVATDDTVECSVSRTSPNTITVNTGSFVPGTAAMEALITKIL